MTPPSTTAKNYKGVRLRKWGRWGAEIRIPKSSKKIWLGAFSSVEEAARAYDVALYCLKGPNSPFNFPDSPPNINDVPDSPDAIIKISRSHALKSQLENNDRNISAVAAAAAESSPALDCYYSQQNPAVADDNEWSLCCEICCLCLMGSECVNHHTLLDPLLWPELQQEEDLLAVFGEPDSFQNIWGFAEF